MLDVKRQFNYPNLTVSMVTVDCLTVITVSPPTVFFLVTFSIPECELRGGGGMLSKILFRICTQSFFTISLGPVLGLNREQKKGKRVVPSVP